MSEKTLKFILTTFLLLLSLSLSILQFSRSVNGLSLTNFFLQEIVKDPSVLDYTDERSRELRKEILNLKLPRRISKVNFMLNSFVFLHVVLRFVPISLSVPVPVCVTSFAS